MNYPIAKNNLGKDTTKTADNKPPRLVKPSADFPLFARQNDQSAGKNKADFDTSA